MRTKVSTKGQVVLPGLIRSKLGIRAGDQFKVDIEDGRIILTPSKSQPHPVRIVDDPITGLPVLSAGPEAPMLTSREVEEILANFP